MYESGGKHWLKHLDFMIMDLICLEFCYVISFFVRFRGDAPYHILDAISMDNPYQLTMLFLMLIHLCIVIFAEPYSGILRRGFLLELRTVFIYNLFVLAGLVMVFFMTHSSGQYSRIVIFSLPAFDFVLMLFYHELYKMILRYQINHGAKQDCILIVAPLDQVQRFVEAFTDNKLNIVKPVGIVLVDGKTEEKVLYGIPVVGSRDSIYEYARTNVVDEVLLYAGMSDTSEIAKTYNSMGITVHIVLDSLIQMDQFMLNEINGIPVMTSYRNKITPGQMFIKRMIDILAGLVGSVIAIVLTILIAPMIWIQDPGPVFFRQERVGRNGRTFKMWKFRTMVVNAEALKKNLMDQNEVTSGNMFKLEKDPRIIGINKKFSVGQFLRSTSLDEFPQFFNILAGSMSLIGTRPPTKDEVEKYELHHKGRLALRPGLTGMWQVYGRSNITDFEQVVELDKYYIEHCSLALDMKLLFKTVGVVLKREGAK